MLAACGASSPTPRAPPPASVTDACPNTGGLVLEVPETIPDRWSGALITAGTAPATLRWCGAGIVGIDRLVLTTPQGIATEWAFDPAATRLSHGQSVTHEIHGMAEPMALVLTATAHDGAGHALVASAHTRSVPDPRFEAARDACLARGGTFAPAGMMQAYACDAPTHDAGRRCTSSADCESACLETHTEIGAGSCAAGEEVRVHVGECSPHTLRFGCSPLLDRVTTECVVTGQATRQRTVCID